jgi:arabinose-5-phosphate isomerase
LCGGSDAGRRIIMPRMDRPSRPGSEGDNCSAVILLARQILGDHARAVADLAGSVGAKFEFAVDLIAGCANRLVLTGVGKSGVVARQISATFVRTGMPSLFVHPTDAAHGDLGAIAGDDLVLAVSSSGRTEEILSLVPHLRSRCRAILAIVGDESSPLGREADLALEVPVADDVMVAAPMASSVATLALADALAVSVMQRRALPRDVLARNHPGGSRGALARLAGELEAAPGPPSRGAGGATG